MAETTTPPALPAPPTVFAEPAPDGVVEAAGRLTEACQAWAQTPVGEGVVASETYGAACNAMQMSSNLDAAFWTVFWTGIIVGVFLGMAVPSVIRLLDWIGRGAFRLGSGLVARVHGQGDE
jgi:hypothetical protein